jgi:predicted component of type VI protein secretion system
MNGESRLPRVRFNPEVNLGHILQIIALTGAVVTWYVSLQRDMASMRAEYQVAIAGFESRLTVAEHAIVERRQEDREFAAEMRAAVVEIQKGLNNLQLQLVERAKAR